MDVAICSDMDVTLIDTGGLYEREQKVAEGHGIPKEIYRWAAEEEFGRRYGSHDGFSFGVLMKILSERFPGLQTRNLLGELLSLLRGQYFFRDTLPFLQKFRGRAEMILLTEGNSLHQGRKIRAHGLEGYFDEICVVKRGHKQDAIRIQPDKKVFVLDDAPRVIDGIKEAHPSAFCIWVRRPPPWEKQKFTTNHDARCFSLTQAGNIIEPYLSA